MRANNLVNGLALAGAMIVLVGVFFAANGALASNVDVVETTAALANEASENAIAKARRATVAAAADAVKAMDKENELDLDIRLIGRKSMIIAGNL
ncbi:MAG: hypothetical protein WBN09_04170 [Woeseiaceae bacterium]